MTARIILHIDLNSFFASVEQLLQPHLQGKAVAVAGNPNERRGIVITCSYEARAYGVKTTMRVQEALKRCPHLHIVEPNFQAYRSYSQRFFTLLQQVSPLLEPVSIDEGYIEITDVAGDRPLEFVEHLQRRIYEELGLPCSIGVAPNKFLAKMASDMKKPMGITVLRKRDVHRVLWPLRIEQMHGVGKQTAKKLHALHIHTIGDLAHGHVGQLKQLLGVQGERLYARANGEDNRLVNPQAMYETKSIGNSTTLRTNTTEERAVYEQLKQLSQKVSARLHAKHLAGTTITLTIRHANWHTTTRSRSVKNAVQDAQAILQIAWQLFEQHWDEQPVRLLGIAVSHVIDMDKRTEQLDLFSFHTHAKVEPLQTIMNEINEKYKKKIIKNGNEIRVKTSNYYANTSFLKDFFDDLK